MGVFAHDSFPTFQRPKAHLFCGLLTRSSKPEVEFANDIVYSTRHAPIILWLTYDPHQTCKNALYF